MTDFAALVACLTLLVYIQPDLPQALTGPALTPTLGGYWDGDLGVPLELKDGRLFALL